MDKNRIAYLIQKLRSHQATPDEADELEAFWQLAKSDRTQFDALSDAERNAIRVAMLEKIRDRIFQLDKVSVDKRRNLPVLSWKVAIAASVSFLIAIAFFLNKTVNANEHFQTAYGEQSSLQLPDESTVIVNGNSSIRYSDQWNVDEDREVWIDGEAFFDVRHTSNNQKFIVHTPGGVDVQVLGTRFNVKVRRGKTEVMLEEGSIRLHVDKDQFDESMMLVPGELAVLSGDRLKKSQVKAAEYTSWKENKLLFNQTPLRDIALLLEDTHGMSVVFEDSAMMDRKLSGEITANKTVDIIKAIEESMAIEILQDGSRVIFQQEKN